MDPRSLKFKKNMYGKPEVWIWIVTRLSMELMGLFLLLYILSSFFLFFLGSWYIGGVAN